MQHFITTDVKNYRPSIPADYFAVVVRVIIAKAVVDAARHRASESASPSIFYILEHMPIASHLLPVEKQGAMVMGMDTALLLPDPDIGRIKPLAFIFFDDIGDAGRDVFIA